MIYVDSSVALSQLLAEDRHPPDEFWQRTLFASRLLEYECWTRIHARGLGESHGPLLTELIEGLALVELRPEVLQRACLPFPVAVRTLDALHLASALFLAERGREVQVATYDRRLAMAAESAGLGIHEL